MLPVRGCIRDGVPPVVFEELLSNGGRGQQQWPAGIVTGLDTQISESGNQPILLMAANRPCDTCLSGDTYYRPNE
jgi:hypothetical protein